MSATLILSVVLIWVMACSICMLWFGNATRHTNPGHSEPPGHVSPAVFWGGVFALCSAGWLLVHWWGRH
ncbi:hypothetical protein [Haloferula sp. BvORR071]|uniref:hypothetical protein n=1 Tax=Haloferula sp. BvORR071 TaxID=1396141 RepID=UPI00054F5F65|nr:hypothetical protein [Haloferula sp. BvORR071]